jgi:tagatose 6-phosphate kinase
MARVVVVTPNPAIDVTYGVADQTPGESHRVASVERRPGGKGVNVARALLALGHDPVNVLPLGGGSGDWMRLALADLGLAASVTPIAGLTRTCVAISDPHGHPTVYNEPGPAVSVAEWRALLADTARLLADASMLVVSGSLPSRSDVAIITSLVGAAKAAGVPVLLDVSGPSLVAAARAGADVLKPNAEELLEATGEDTLDDAVAAIRELGADLVVVSRGTDGIMAVDGRQRYAVDAVTGVTGNPTGAGDAATAGLAAALLDGLPLTDALRWAAALGAAAVLRPVAGEVDLDAFQRFLSRPNRARIEPA